LGSAGERVDPCGTKEEKEEKKLPTGISVKNQGEKKLTQHEKWGGGVTSAGKKSPGSWVLRPYWDQEKGEGNISRVAAHGTKEKGKRKMEKGNNSHVDSGAVDQ